MVGGRIRPTVPTDNSPLPWITYAKIAEDEEEITFEGARISHWHYFVVDIWAVTEKECRDIEQAVYDCLSDWNDPENGIQLALKTTVESPEQERGYNRPSFWQVYA